MIKNRNEVKITRNVDFGRKRNYAVNK